MKFICRQSVLNEAVNSIIATNKSEQTNNVKSSDTLPDIVYHGTISIHKDSLLAGINVKAGFESADFGQGFYTTSNYEQAKKLAFDRAKAYNKRYPNKRAVKPMVLSYRLNKSLLSHYKGLIFDSPTEKWKEFIFNNRVGMTF